MVHAEVNSALDQCPIMPVAPPRSAWCVGAPSNGGKNGRMYGMTCVIALIGVAVTAARRAPRSLKPDVGGMAGGFAC